MSQEHLYFWYKKNWSHIINDYWVHSSHTVLPQLWRDDCRLFTSDEAHRKLLSESGPAPHLLPVPLLESMAALFQLSGPISSCPHKHTLQWRNGNEVPFQRPHRECSRPTLSRFQIPRVSLQLLSLGLWSEGRSCRRSGLWGRFRDRSGSDRVVQAEAPTQNTHTRIKPQKGTVHDNSR